MPSCPRSAFTPRGNKLRIFARIDEEEEEQSGDLLSCGRDEMLCCYDDELELERSAGPICEGPPSGGGGDSDWGLVGCEETEFEEEYQDPDLPIVPRQDIFQDLEDKTCGMRRKRNTTIHSFSPYLFYFLLKFLRLRDRPRPGQGQGQPRRVPLDLHRAGRGRQRGGRLRHRAQLLRQRHQHGRRQGHHRRAQGLQAKVS